MDNLIQFNQKVKILRDQQIPRGQTTGERDRDFLGDFDNFGYQPDDQPMFPAQGSDIGDRSRMFQLDGERSPNQLDRGLLEPTRIEEISLYLDRENFEDKITTSEVFISVAFIYFKRSLNQ